MFSSGPVIIVVTMAITSNMVNKGRLMIPASRPTEHQPQLGKGIQFREARTRKYCSMQIRAERAKDGRAQREPRDHFPDHQGLAEKLQYCAQQTCSSQDDDELQQKGRMGHAVRLLKILTRPLWMGGRRQMTFGTTTKEWKQVNVSPRTIAKQVTRAQPISSGRADGGTAEQEE
jgi:hypothetical protein